MHDIHILQDGPKVGYHLIRICISMPGIMLHAQTLIAIIRFFTANKRQDRATTCM